MAVHPLLLLLLLLLLVKDSNHGASKHTSVLGGTASHEPLHVS
jgi:hypothetical protein